MPRLKSFSKLAVCAALCLLGVVNASATLLDRGVDLVYDDVLNITWTRQAGDGLTRVWPDAVTWANDLVFAGFNDWRLPWASVIEGAGPGFTVVNCATATELQCRDNEMGYMFYHNLGGIFGISETGTQTALGGEVLTGIQFQYWSGTEFINTLNGIAQAYRFVFANGNQSEDRIFFDYAGWAVRDGDVAPPIPEPEIYAMLGMGLGFMGWIGRRKRLQAVSV